MATKKITDKSGVQSYDVGKADNLVLTGVKAGGGSDNIYLEGNSSDYTVSVSGGATKTVLLSNSVTGQTVSIALSAPAAGSGIGENIYFLDGGAWLSYKISPTGDASVSLGKQAITETPTALASSALTFSGNSSSHFQMYTLTVDSPSVAEGDDGTVALTYTLTLDKTATAPVVINYWNAAGGTATANVDFVGKSTKITIPKGEQTAQVTFNVKGDTLVEPNETVNVKFSGPYLTSPVTATGTIVDNDTPPEPTYALSSSGDSVDEGGSVTFSLATTNVPAGSVLSYTITGVDAADVAGGALTGSFVVGTSDSVTIALNADNTTEGAETLRLALDNGGAAAAVVVNDTSLTPVPTYALSPDTVSVDEGGKVVYTLVTTNVEAGKEIPYTISGVQAEDVLGGSLAGVFTVGADGTATATVRLKADSTTEGAETLMLALDNGAATAADVTVNDTSVNTAPTITGAEAVSGGVNTDIALPNLKFVDAEDNNLTVTVTATGGSVSGLADADSVAEGIQLTGTADEVTKAFADATFSGARVGTGHVTVVANDGMLDSAPATLDVTLNPTYSVTPSAATVNEGKSVTYTLATDGVKSGTAIPYTITGIDAADLSKGSLTGKFVVGKTDTVTLTLKSDNTTEGDETIHFSLDGGLATATDVTVKDTSTTPPTYTLTASAPSVDEGSTVTYSLATTEVAAGTKLAYTIAGITSADLSKGSAPLTGEFVVGTTDSITLRLANDKATEGPETATLSLDGIKAATPVSVTVNDTSLTPNTAPTISGAVAASGDVNTNIPLADLTFADVENDNLTVTVTATNGTVNGLTDADTALAGIQLKGTPAEVTVAFAAATFTGTTAGAGSVSVIANDGTVSSPSTTLDVTLNATYALSASASAVDEGGSVTYTLTTAGLAAGASVPYTISGVQAADVTGSLAGSFTVGADGSATATVGLVADKQTEGAETLKLALDNGKASAADVTVNDTSKAGVDITGAGSSDAAGGDVRFTLTNPGNYTYSISGFGAGDVIDFPETQAPTVNNVSFTDSSVDLQWAFSGNVVVVTLTGLSAEQDVSLFSVSDFNTVFGAGTII